MKKHFVTFYSPGTFVAEHSIEPIESWDVGVAIEMARNVKKRHGATPYGFQFSTRERSDTELDSKESAKSAMYYLGGKVFTLAQLKKCNNPSDRTLIANMECNGWKKVVINNNSWQWTQPLMEGDEVLDV